MCMKPTSTKWALLIYSLTWGQAYIPLDWFWSPHNVVNCNTQICFYLNESGWSSSLKLLLGEMWMNWQFALKILWNETNATNWNKANNLLLLFLNQCRNTNKKTLDMVLFFGSYTLYHKALSFPLSEGSRNTALLALDISHTLQEGMASQLKCIFELQLWNSIHLKHTWLLFLVDLFTIKPNSVKLTSKEINSKAMIHWQLDFQS